MNRRLHIDQTSGFTLLELLVVMGVISVLMGISLGFLSKSTGRPEALSALAGELRAASLSARTAGLPTEVLLVPGEPGELTTVRGRSLQPIVVFHCEPTQDFLSPDLRPRLLGADVEHGRFGHARRQRSDERAPLLTWPVPQRVADFRDGFALRIDLLLEQRAAATLYKLGRMLDVNLEPDGEVRVRLQLGRADGNPGPAATLRSDEALPLQRWCTLEVAADGSTLWVNLDGRELGRVPAPGAPLQHRDNDVLEVSSADTPVPGLIDELRVFGYRLGQPQQLPLDVIVAKPVRIAFDAAGEPVGSPTIELQLLKEERTEVLRVLRGGVLQ